jgi:c-di-GMP-binding flagellar brake protein YcgR
MKLSDLNLGLKFELEIYNELDEIIKPSFVSQLEMIIDENRALIAAPIHEGVIYPVRVGSIMNVFFIQNKEDYRFRAMVSSRGIKDNIAMLNIEIGSEIQRIQRRQFFRFECTVPIKYRIVDFLDAEYEKAPFKKTSTRDMSGGGLCFAAEEKIEAGTIIECELSLFENKTISFFGKVLRSIIRENNKKGIYEIGIEFKKIENKDREALIGYIFLEQRNLRKKGLI